MNSVKPDVVDSIRKEDIRSSGAEKHACGSASSISELFEKHNQSLLRFLIAKLGSEQEAQDVAQEAYAKLLGLDNDKIISHMQAYLFRTANNLAIDRLRSRKRLNETALPEFEDNNTSSYESAHAVENAADAQQQLRLIQTIVAELPAKCRMAFLLYKFECLSYEEIAESMQLTESMVRKYVLRAIRYCHERLEQLS